MQRKYQMTRVRTGDYIVPSNDATTLWRVYSYEEEGSLVEYPAGDTSYTNGTPVVGTFWATAKFAGPFDKAQRLVERDPDEFLEWSNWIIWDTFCRTRREALASIFKEAEAGMER